jgi:hypothetical protein
MLVGEAELGERIMRALILRRVGLLQAGIGGPVIVGRAGSADVLRLAGFLSRNGHPHQVLDPDTDASARTLIEGFHVDAEQLLIVLCPNGRMLRNPSEVELARCLGLVHAIDPNGLYDVAIVGADPNTSWLSESGVALDAKGFVRTGADVAEGRRALETSQDGVFAIGDVRAGSTKRVAAAVGEGAQVIATVHAFLANAGQRGGGVVAERAVPR